MRLGLRSRKLEVRAEIANAVASGGGSGIGTDGCLFGFEVYGGVMRGDGLRGGL